MSAEVPEPPALGRLKLDGFKVYVQDESPCVMVAVWPPIVSVAVLADPVVFAAIWTNTLPAPVPDAVVTTAHGESLAAVHAHPEGATTSSATIAAFPGNTLLAGLTT